MLRVGEMERADRSCDGEEGRVGVLGATAGTEDGLGLVAGVRLAT